MNKIEEFSLNLIKLATIDLHKLIHFYEDSCYLVTPLEEVKGRSQVLEYYRRMRQEIALDEFNVVSHLQSENLVCITWKCEFTKLKKKFQIHGVSYTELSQEGLVLT